MVACDNRDHPPYQGTLANELQDNAGMNMNGFG
jgi:hypothetical protein